MIQFIAESVDQNYYSDVYAVVAFITNRVNSSKYLKSVSSTQKNNLAQTIIYVFAIYKEIVITILESCSMLHLPTQFSYSMMQLPTHLLIIIFLLS